MRSNVNRMHLYIEKKSRRRVENRALGDSMSKRDSESSGSGVCEADSKKLREELSRCQNTTLTFGPKGRFERTDRGGHRSCGNSLHNSDLELINRAL